MRHRVLGLSLATTLLVSLAHGEAQRCITENEQATRQRAEGKLSEAKRHYLACAAQECPAVVREECQSLAQKMETSIPTVVFVLVDSKGSDVAGARAFIDDAKAAVPLDGHAITLDPGTHRIKVEAPSGAGIDQTVVAREGEKNRRVRIELPALAKTPSPDPEATSGPPAGEATARRSTLVWVLAGAAVVGAGSFGYFALSGRHQENDLKTRCAPLCADSEVDKMYRSYLFADVSLGVSLVAASVAGYLLLSAPSGGASSSSAGPTPPLDVRLGKDGVAIGYQGTFR